MSLESIFDMHPAVIFSDYQIKINNLCVFYCNNCIHPLSFCVCFDGKIIAAIAIGKKCR